MPFKRKPLLFLGVFTLLSLIGLITAALLNSNFGTIHIEPVSISHTEFQISGLLYRPKSVSSMTSYPAVVLAHGIGSSKEYMSGIALELSRRGIVSLTVDEIGHGNSGGIFGFANDPTLGILSAVRYVESLSYVNNTSIGLIGHSLGAGAVRATSFTHGNIAASVLIGGGVGEMVEGEAYGVINATFPKNLLIAVGIQDILFDIPSLREALIPVFNTTSVIEPNIQYGNFSTYNARKLVLTSTIHLAEAFDPFIISEIIQWMELTLNPKDQFHLSSSDLLFNIRDFIIIISVFTFIGFICSFSAVLYDLLDITKKKHQELLSRFSHENWQILLLWSCIGAILFLPMMITGIFIPFPPLLFGTSFIWWLFIWGILGMLLIKYFIPKNTNINPNFKKIVLTSLNKQEILIIMLLIVLIYFISFFLKVFLNINFQILTPLFGDLFPIPRLFIFFIYIPFLFINFFTDGLFFYEYYDNKGISNVKSTLLQFFKYTGIKIAPFMTIIFILYVPLFLFNLKFISGFLGLILEFLWGIIPIFIISSIFTYWFYRLSRSIGPGALFNALIIAWIIADTFTMGGFL